MSESNLAFRFLKHIPIPMPDGVKLSAHVILPENPRDGKFPAILEYSPYHKGIYDQPNSRQRTLLENGYAVVHVDIRGCGDSEGWTNTFADPRQIADGVEVVEWIARQTWSDGTVGMWGISYVGFVTYQVAMHAPRPLKAIVCYQAMTDHYTSYMCPGGAPRPFPFEQTSPLMTAYNAVPPNPEIVGEKWSQMWRDRIENCEPWGLSYIQNLLDGPYWRERSLPPDFARVKAATFFVGGWADWYPDDFLRAFAALECPKRVLIGPWAHSYPENALPLPQVDDVRECVRWFDQFLKGEDTGIAKEPPIQLFVQEFSPPGLLRIEERGTFRSENEWPLKRAKNTPYYLREDGKLLATAPTSSDARDAIDYDPSVGVAAGRYVIGQMPPAWGSPLDQRLDEARSLVFSTDVFEHDTEVTGHPRVILHASSSAEIAYFSAKLCDVAPDGTSALVSKAGLNATHRESHVNPSALKPCEIYELTFDLQAMSYVFKAGHRARLMIACADVQHAWPTPQRATNAIHRSTAHASRIVLPIVGPQERTLPPPNLKILDNPPLRRESFAVPKQAITRDFPSETTTVSYSINVGAGVNRSDFTVSATDPARAAVKAHYDHHCQRAGLTIDIHSHCTTTSDAKAFHHVVELQIDVDGKPYFQKSWAGSAARKFV